MSDEPRQNDPSYTYEQAGVSIEAGNALVRAIGPLVKATMRPGADGEIGGFGGFFDPKAAGYKDPLLVAGNDDGLSLFRLTPEGRLVHHDTLPDGLDMALGGVSGLATQITPTGFNIVTTAAGDGGISLFEVEFANPGAVIQAPSGVLTGTSGDDMLSLRDDAGRINGMAGDDVLIDGPGEDILTGGAGRDTFVLRLDGARDIQPGDPVRYLPFSGFGP